MGKEIAFLALFFFVVCSALSLSEGAKLDDKFKVVGYVPEYRLHAINWEMVAPILSHAILFSIEMDASGNIVATERLPDAENLQAIQSARERDDLKVLIGFGGNGRSQDFATVSTNEKARKKFIFNVVQLIEEYQLDGVDYNWEYPGFDFRTGYLSNKVIRKEFNGLCALVRETRDAFDKASRPLEITLAYYPDGIQERLLKNYGIVSYVDLIHAMAYDQGRIDHSPIALVETVIKYATVQKLPLEKVTVGVPFYGRDEKTGHASSYEEILEIDPATASFRANNAIYRFGRDQAMTYNGPAMIEKKTKMALEAGLGGVMIWELGQDCRMKEVTRNGQTHAKTCPSLGNSLLYSINMGRKEYFKELVKKERVLEMSLEIEEQPAKIKQSKEEL